MLNPLITVIVPVYNVEDYLDECVNSILDQNYKNLEIILVDDGSSDNCPQLCDNFAKHDSRIRVIHKANGGLSDARNAAIDIARGEYLIFVDGDDFIAKDMVTRLYDSLEANNCDIATCDYYKYYTGRAITKDAPKNIAHVLSSENALEDMLYQKHATTSAWAKLYKRELFLNIRYPKGKICEDLDTTYKLFSNSKKIVFNSFNGYFYRQREDSIIASDFSAKRMDALDFAHNLVSFVGKKHPKILLSAHNRIFMESVFILSQIPRSQSSNSIQVKKCEDIIKSYRKCVLLDSDSKLTYRLFALMSFVGCSTLCRIYNLKGRVGVSLRSKYA